MDFLSAWDFPVKQVDATRYLYVILTLLIAILLDNLLRSYVRIPQAISSKRAITFVTIVKSSITVIVYLIAIYSIFLQLNIPVTGILASASITGVILGISARPVIEDLITGIFLLSQHTIEINDYVKIDDIEGYIESIGLRTLTVRTLSGSIVIIPNGLVKKVSNFSRYRSTVTINLPLKVDQDIDKILDAADKALKLLHKEESLTAALYPGSKVEGISDYTNATGSLQMIIQVSIVVASAKRWQAGNKYRYFLKKEFEKAKLKGL